MILWSENFYTEVRVKNLWGASVSAIWRQHRRNSRDVAMRWYAVVDKQITTIIFYDQTLRYYQKLVQKMKTRSISQSNQWMDLTRFFFSLWERVNVLLWGADFRFFYEYVHKLNLKFVSNIIRLIGDLFRNPENERSA